MKKLLIGLSTLFLLLLDGCGCSQSHKIHYKEPMYVSPTEYKKLSCKELDYELYNFGHYSCKELREKLVYISPTEYEKLSCKQLNEELIKHNERLDVKSQIERDETAAMIIAVPFFFLTTAGVPLLFKSESDSREYYEKKSKEDSAIKKLKKEYEALKDIAIKKNCSFAADMK